jgi:hypothetical protein
MAPNPNLKKVMEVYAVIQELAASSAAHGPFRRFGDYMLVWIVSKWPTRLSTNRLIRGADLSGPLTFGF